MVVQAYLLGPLRKSLADLRMRSSPCGGHCDSCGCKLRQWVPGITQKFGASCLNNGRVWGMVAYHFGLLEATWICLIEARTALDSLGWQLPACQGAKDVAPGLRDKFSGWCGAPIRTSSTTMPKLCTSTCVLLRSKQEQQYCERVVADFLTSLPSVMMPVRMYLATWQVLMDAKAAQHSRLKLWTSVANSATGLLCNSLL